jgi:hypothetical protein
VGFKFTGILMVVGSLLWLWGARYLAEDTEKAPRRVAEPAGVFPVAKSE